MNDRTKDLILNKCEELTDLTCRIVASLICPFPPGMWEEKYDEVARGIIKSLRKTVLDERNKETVLEHLKETMNEVNR